MKIKINEIHVAERIRKECGDLKPLADSIREHGLLNQITVMLEQGHYLLIAGYRRLQAAKSLGWHEIAVTAVTPMEADELLRIEVEENELRKNFTVSERLAYASKIKAIEQQKARQRMGAHNLPKEDTVAGCPNGDTLPDEQPAPKKLRTDDVVAQRSGISSRQQLERATYVAENRPDLLE